MIAQSARVLMGASVTAMVVVIAMVVMAGIGVVMGVVRGVVMGVVRMVVGMLVGCGRASPGARAVMKLTQGSLVVVVRASVARWKRKHGTRASQSHATREHGDRRGNTDRVSGAEQDASPRGGHHHAQRELRSVDRRCFRAPARDEIDDAPDRHTRARDHRELQRRPRGPDENKTGQTEQEPSSASCES